MHIRLRKTASGSINIIPLIVASQVASKYNKHFMELLEKLFKSLNIPITNYQLPITNYQLPITNYQLPITNYQLKLKLKIIKIHIY